MNEKYLQTEELNWKEEVTKKIQRTNAKEGCQVAFNPHYDDDDDGGVFQL